MKHYNWHNKFNWDSIPANKTINLKCILIQSFKNNFNRQIKKPGLENWGQGYTFLFFFIFEGGHRPFFLKRRFITSLFLRSLIFLANFILNLCSSSNCCFDSKGRSSTGISVFSPSDGGGSTPSGPVPSASEDAFTINAPLSLMIEDVLIWSPHTDFGCKPVKFLHNL